MQSPAPEVRYVGGAGGQWFGCSHLRHPQATTKNVVCSQRRAKAVPNHFLTEMLHGKETIKNNEAGVLPTCDLLRCTQTSDSVPSRRMDSRTRCVPPTSFCTISSTARVGFKVRGASVLLWSISREYQQLVSSSVLGESTSFCSEHGCVVRLSLLLVSFSDPFVLNHHTAGSAFVGPSSGYIGLAGGTGGGVQSPFQQAMTDRERHSLPTGNHAKARVMVTQKGHFTTTCCHLVIRR